MNIEVRIDGTSPLLQHRFSGDGQPAPKSKVKNRTQTREDVESYLYKNGTDEIYQPSTHLICTMKKAGARFQIPGQGKLTYKNLLGSGVVIVSPDAIPHVNQEWTTDLRSVIINRARIMRSRPRFEEWALEFLLDIEEDEVPQEVLQEILEYAGKRVGIGDFRPEKGGSFGRFQITKWEIQ